MRQRTAHAQEHQTRAGPGPADDRLNSHFRASGLQGRPVVALTEVTAAIQSSTGAITTYRRHNKPALARPATASTILRRRSVGALHDCR